MLLKGTASGQRVILSMMVSRCEKSSGGGNGPTRSMCKWLNLFDGTGILITGECTCDWILDFCHARHSCVHWLICFFRPCQTNFCDTNFTNLIFDLGVQGYELFRKLGVGKRGGLMGEGGLWIRRTATWSCGFGKARFEGL